MSNNKNKNFEDIAEIFKALSNPNRLKIFIRLATCCTPGTVGVFEGKDSAYVGELGEELDIVKSTVSHHIKELRRVGLIRTRRQGQKIECWVDPELVEKLRQFFVF
jgi:ArsR family transcriptional regulator